MGRFNRINIGIIGGFQNGKSTFVNCLLDDMVARTGGYGLSVTSINTIYKYGEVQNVSYISNNNQTSQSGLSYFFSCDSYPKQTKQIVVSLWKPILNNINIIDTPGFNANEEDTSMATASLLDIDIAVLIIENKGISKTELNILSLLRNYHIPFYVIMNCRDHMGDSWRPKSTFNDNIAKKIIEKIHEQGLKPVPIHNIEIWQTNLIWFWFASEQFLSETEDKQKNYKEDIEFYSSKHKNPQQSIRDFCLRESNFLPLRQFFSDDSLWNNFPLTMTRWRKTMDSILSDWENKITK